ncbi:4-hydroxythreonine-4-phosphate dehydrogenase PdxA [Hwanghaeella grinnelliae]|uniref:4-hydroxythreonine-4-phosphate dehydrogenase PdxA n=1 Tax=Hwanghaeella grinnelliae TaxID=2500179 RepID=A0A437QNU5_9PROT|nr:4-hydroxythreonine-4-phosphate dehydrogenase PdxA [Hwanghaeella grinnelliae]RVU36135.1 4-hydroxythreonine-4-phosphate dehydrogenase PdxA [Hwanghaeella grinnelliae]
MTPRITLLLGDRNGIGPELIARLLADPKTADSATVEVLGDPAVLDQGIAAAGVSPDPNGFSVTPFTPIEIIETTPGMPTEAAGREMLAMLAEGTRRVLDGKSDGVVFGPLNKEAMHKGGLTHEDEMRYLADVLDFHGTVGELNVLGGLWTTRVTSHIPLKHVADHITVDSVYDATLFAHRTLASAGFDRPRIAVAALNPHAGDGGNFGMEEIEVIAPAVEKAKAQQLAVEGPYPSDTVFVRARNGDFDAVVTMYHDQGQIAMKLMGFAEGVTVLGGLPVPVTTCGHGTGYDIVGQGAAKPGSITNAFAICTAMARARNAEAAA